MASHKHKAKPLVSAPPKAAPAILSRRRLVVLVAILLALLVVAIVTWTRPGPSEPDPPPRLPPAEDPRLTIATEYLNVKPHVKYVGDDACAGCHRGIGTSFHQHPMGRSMAPVAAASASTSCSASMTPGSTGPPLRMWT